MEKHYSSEFNTSSTSQEITCILLNPTTHYHFQKSFPLVPNPSQINPANLLSLPQMGLLEVNRFV